MSTEFQSIVGSVQKLPLVEQLELMQVISKSLYHNYHHSLHSVDFRQTKTIKQLLKDRRKSPIADINELTVDFWPEEESVDDFIDYTYRQRQEDRLRD
ncbi:MAG: hypothetical protein KAW12_23665 [Candidatus Aminicenantes bacterium]|nr:hypothetical protein [Candidatus Aminicenantes bacterium]